MSKALEICNCTECPNCLFVDEWEYFYCDFTCRVLVAASDEIPDWCPLPEYKED